MANPSNDSDDPATVRALPLTDIFLPNCFKILPPGISKTAVINLLVQALAQEYGIDPPSVASIASALQIRERYATSALGKGFAFPHLRIRAFPSFIGAIGASLQGIDFKSLDNEPTKIVFLTITPWSARVDHTILQGRLVGLMQNKSVCMRIHNQDYLKRFHDYLSDLDEPLRASTPSALSSEHK